MAEATASTEAATRAAFKPPADSKPEEIYDFLRSYSVSNTSAARKEVLDDRYVIRMHQPLAHFNAYKAKAYEATDERNPDREIYALVFPVGATARTKATSVLLQTKIPHMVELLGLGLVEFASPTRQCQVAILEKPKGKTLLQLLREKKSPFPDGFLADKVIRPIGNMMKALEEKGLCHGHINLETLYFGDELTIGQCIADMPGVMQNYIYEPMNRALCDPLGRGEDSSVADSFALGVSVLQLTLGATPFENVSRDVFITKALSAGMYNSLTHNLEFSEYLRDMLRGCLNDERSERWDSREILQWVEGKRYNLITPSPPRDAPRGFVFEGSEYFNFKALANGLFSHWDAARATLRDTKLTRWVELSAHKREVAEMLHKAVRGTGGEGNTSEKLGNELVARSICVLDPDGPLRYKILSTRINGIGYYLTHALAEKNHKLLAALTDIIEMDIANLWTELQKNDIPQETSTMVWKLQKIKFSVKNKTYGFGIERALYDLSPSLPCQSQMLLNHHVTDIAGLLHALDRIASQIAKDLSPVDRHIAAFITSKLDTPKDIHVNELRDVGNLHIHPELITLKLLTMASEKSGNPKLPGLCHWLALRLSSVVEQLHNRKLRAKMFEDLKKIARTGNIGMLYMSLVNHDLLKGDHQGFAQASHIYTTTGQNIEKLKDINEAKKEALDLALKTSLGLAYLTCCISLYYFAKQIQPLITF